MESLTALAGSSAWAERTLPSGRTVHLRELHVRFPEATPRHIVAGLPKTYRSKPLVSADGDAVFGEIAILIHLRKDGWDGVWVDTFHRRFWRDMPHRSERLDASSLPGAVRHLVERIRALRGGLLGGFFDVLAWRGGEILCVEYKGPGDRPNRNEGKWIDAALDAGVPAGRLFFVVGH